MVTGGNLSTPGVGFNRAARSLRRVAFHGRGDCWIQSLLFMSGGKPRHHAFERFAVEGDATGAQSYDDLPGTSPALRVSAQPSATNRRLEGNLKAEAYCHRPGRAYRSRPLLHCESCAACRAWRVLS